MSEKFPISVHILTWNSAATLAAALESVKQCEEILLIDGGSTDATLEIGKRYGAKILNQPSAGAIKDFSAVRNIGLAHATEPWILVLDSDEIVSPDLLREIAMISQTNKPKGYLVPRKYVMADGTVIQFASTYPNEHLYFFHRDAVDGWIKPVHERVKLKPGIPVEHLKHPCLAPLPTIVEYKRKNERYIAIEAESSRTDGWLMWLKRRVFHTARSRAIGLLRLLRIWLIPRTGARLPLRHELLRFWYGWRLVVETCPWKTRICHPE